MIALHCTVTLPRDYDLDRVRARIAATAGEHDDATGLVLFAHGLREAGTAGIAAHRYALVSVWANTSRMGAYMWEEGGLERVRAQYGAITATLWPLAGLQIDRSRADTASTLEIGTGPANADAPLWRLGGAQKAAAARAMGSRDVHAAAHGIEAATGASWWCHVRTGRSRADEGESYALAHLSLPDRG